MGDLGARSLRARARAIKLTLYLLAWAFVFLVAAVDLGWALRHFDRLEDWELNPVAVWAAGWGTGGVAAVRVIPTALAAAVVAISPGWGGRLITGVAVAAHAYLVSVYTILIREGFW